MTHLQTYRISYSEYHKPGQRTVQALGWLLICLSKVYVSFSNTCLGSRLTTLQAPSMCFWKRQNIGEKQVRAGILTELEFQRARCQRTWPWRFSEHLSVLWGHRALLGSLDRKVEHRCGVWGPTIQEKGWLFLNWKLKSDQHPLVTDPKENYGIGVFNSSKWQMICGSKTWREACRSRSPTRKRNIEANAGVSNLAHKRHYSKSSSLTLGSIRMCLPIIPEGEKN